MPQPAAILFDLDGTLVDTIDLLIQSMEFAFEHFDGRRPTRDEWVYGIGTTLRSQLQPYMRSPDELEAIVARYRVYQLEHHDRMTTPYPGVTEVLTELKTALEDRALCDRAIAQRRLLV